MTRGHLNPERRALARLAEAGLARRVDVAAKQRGGRRGPREWLAFLSESRGGEAIVAGARMCGLKDPKKAKTDYLRGGLKGRHTKVRTDFLLGVLLDAGRANADARRGVVEVPLPEMFGEAHPSFPLLGAKVTADGAGRKLAGIGLAKAGYEEILPDARFVARWPGAEGEPALECAYDVELELWTRTEDVAGKIDARAAMFARLYRDHRGASLRAHRETPGQGTAHFPDDRFVGLPPGCVPVVFLFETASAARSMRARVANLDPPRYAALRGQVSRLGVSVGRFFAFAGLDELLPGGVEESGRTLEDTYGVLERDGDGGFLDGESLRSIAEYRRETSLADPFPSENR